jgi:hypothetical protein
MAAATMYVTVAGGDPTHDGTAWSKAFSMADFLADLTNNAESGDIYYVMAGTYTLTGAHDSTARDGGAGTPISIIGVKDGTNHDDSVPVYADWGSGADRPTFACGANTFKVGTYHKIYNCIFTGTGGSIPDAETYSVLYNCKSTVTSDSNVTSHTLGSGSKVINCEITGAGAGAHTGLAGIASSLLTVLFSYIHDMGTGGTGSTATSSRYVCNVFDTLAIGVSMGTTGDAMLLNNTFYECDTAVAGSSSYGNVFINNIIEGSNTDGFKQTTQRDSNFYAYNHGNDTRDNDIWDTIAVTLPHGELGGGSEGAASAYSGGDPKITNAATGAFDLASDSPCIDAGMSLTLGVTAASEMNQGAWDAVTAAASGSSPRFGDMTGGLK